MKQAPFNVGQRVVCLKNGRHHKKDIVYTCAELLYCEKCDNWHVLTSETTFTPASGYYCDCHGEIGVTIYLGGNVKYFAPIEENTYENISKELAVLPQDEVPDVKEIKELVN